MSAWLDVPLDDYEAHMAAVRQLEALAHLFEIALRETTPDSVAILGIAGGNGLDRIPPTVRRICGIDLNPAYLDRVQQRYPNLPGLELHCVDLSERAATIPPVGLVHAAMIFEHAGTGPCLQNAVSLIAPGGHLSVVLQLPSVETPGVSLTPYPTMQRLSDDFRLIDPAHFRALVADRGFRLRTGRHHDLPGGKAFWLGIFEL